MKHPLTSKERRGLVAVAATALLCIASGFIFRNCSSINKASGDTPVETCIADSLSDGKDTTSLARDSEVEKKDKSDSTGKKRKHNKGKSGKSETDNKKKTKGKKNKKSPKTYPTRDPLSQPCD